MLKLLIILSLCSAASAHGSELLVLEKDISALTVSPSGRAVAFLDKEGRDLRFSLIKEKTTHRITEGFVGPSFFWTKDGRHLVYREQSEVSAKIFLFNTFTRTAALLKEETGKISYLTYDPLSETVLYLAGDTLRSLAIKSPGIRKGTWQKNSPSRRFLVSPSAAFLASDTGDLKRLEDDRSGLASFVVSPDGDYLAWATHESKIYIASRDKEIAEFFDYGRDPSWHPAKHVLLYSGARLVGEKVVDFDIKEADLVTGEKFFLTRTQNSKERFPVFEPRKLSVWYTAEDATSLMAMNFAEPKMSKEGERLGLLSAYFRPTPGSQLKLSDFSAGPKFSKNPLTYAGHVAVNPPAKVCLTITKNLDKPDQTVCKKTLIPFQLGDLDPITGELTWQVQRSDETDLGTALTWKSPYRFAQILPLGVKVGERTSEPLILTQCVSRKNDEGEKELVLSTLEKGLTFLVSFPQKDTPLEPAEEPAKEEKDKSKEKKVVERTWESNWNLGTASTFTMDGNRFRSTLSSFPGRKRTECRYTLPQGTKREARLECHNTGEYAFFFAHLSCF